MCATAFRVRVAINVSRKSYEVFQTKIERKAIDFMVDGESPVVLYGQRDFR